MKKALKAAIGLLVVSLTFSSCELIALMMFAGELEDAFSAGVGSVSYPSTLYSGDNSSYVGYGTNGRNSYYKFTVPAGSDAVTITYSSTSNADLDFYLYSNSNFTTLVEEEDSSGTPPTVLFDNQTVVEESTYYLRVYNYTNTEKVYFSLNLSFSYPDPDTTLNTISGNEYSSRANWTSVYLDEEETHWYQLNVNSTSSSVYVHCQDSDDWDDNYYEPSADIKITLYATDGTTVLDGPYDDGYNSDYTQDGDGDGLWSYGYMTYWVKVEGFNDSSYGNYYLSAIEVPVN